MMEKQPEGPKGPKGDLLDNGYVNIFYVPQEVKKLKGNTYSYTNLAGKEVVEEIQDSQYLFEVGGKWYVLRAVRVRWHVDGWHVFASSVEGPLSWYEGLQVFSRNSVLEFSDTLALAQA